MTFKVYLFYSLPALMAIRVLLVSNLARQFLTGTFKSYPGQIVLGKLFLVLRTSVEIFMIFQLFRPLTKSCSVIIKNETSSACLYMLNFIYLVRPCNFCESVEEFLWCNHVNETSSAVLSHGTVRSSIF